jgi:epoxyqueuosine reductase
MVYGCDVCQDVCPWNRGVEKRRAGLPIGDAEPHVSLRAWLEEDGPGLRERYRRLYVPRNDPRWLRRNALLALGNVGDPSDADAAQRFLDGDDEMLGDAARWAHARLEERSLQQTVASEGFGR